MRTGPPAAPRRAAFLALALAALLAAPRPAAAAALPGGLVLRSEGRAPVVAGRSDAAFQQALDAAFRRAVLAALPELVPERQSASDLEGWQTTILARAQDFVAAWRILSQEEDAAGFLDLEVEVGIWRGKLAAAARAGGRSGPAPAARVIVLADPFPAPGRGAEEEIDAGQAAAAALEAELARAGAVIVPAANRAPWRQGGGPASEENRVGLAAAEARRLEADALVIAQLARLGGDRLQLTAQLVAARSESTLAAARSNLAFPADADPAEAFAEAARAVAAGIAPRLGASLAGDRRGARP